MAGQRRLSDDPPPSFHAVVHESALRTRPLSSQDMRAQLQWIVEVSRLPNVSIQIFPFEAGTYSAFCRAFTIYGGPTPELDTVRLEQPITSPLLRDTERISQYARCSPNYRKWRCLLLTRSLTRSLMKARTP